MILVIIYYNHIVFCYISYNWNIIKLFLNTKTIKIIHAVPETFL